ncbi:MAG: ribonuclease [Oscillospiraceae bacterium]|nr:ribonuclease [Oscillospiraceae bacterium]
MPSQPLPAPSPVQSQAAETPSPAPSPIGEAPTLSPEESAPPAQQSPELTVAEDGWYSSKEEVALYLHLFGHLPDNYVTKRQAQDAGWSGGSVEDYTGQGTAIGGSRFGNYEGLLPEADGRTYQECDIDTVGASSRGAKRIVFSNDGLIYYTEDHYASFELLYGEP